MAALTASGLPDLTDADRRSASASAVGICAWTLSRTGAEKRCMMLSWMSERLLPDGLSAPVMAARALLE